MLDYPTGIALDSKGNISVANASGGPLVPHEIYDVGRITIYPPDSNGNVAPAAVISGKQTGLALPLGIALDSQGNIYVANLNTANAGNSFEIGSSITVYSPGSKGDTNPIAIIAGNKTGLVAPRGIALDSEGNLYTEGSVDQMGFSINVYPPDSNGNVAPAAAIFGADTGLEFPVALTLDADRNLYVLSNQGGPAGDGFISTYPADSNGDIAPTTKITSTFDGLDGVSSVAVDSAGNLYVASEFSGSEAGSISIFPPGSDTSSGSPIATIIGADTGLSDPYGIALDSKDNLFVLNDTDEVTVYPTGSIGDATPSTFFTIPTGEGESFPTGIAVNPHGKLYVTVSADVECNRHSCHQINAGSVVVYPAGSDGNGNPSAVIAGPDTGLENPAAIAVDRAGDIYVANQGPLKPKPGCEYLPNGSITTYRPSSDGNAPPVSSIAGPKTGLEFPNGIAFDSRGNIYVSNQLSMLGVCLSFPRINAPTEGDILIFASGSNGDVAPIGSIRGPATGLNNPLGLAIGPMIQ